MIINHNMGAMNATRMMGMNQANASKSMEKLSSGLRINRAGDDAAGLAISEKMRGQIRGLDQASSNAQDAISMIQTAEGGLNETHSILQRMRELAVQSSNDTNNVNDRAEIQKEVTQLKSEITRISTDTEFNTKKLLNGNLGGAVDQNAATSTVLSKTGVATAETSGAKAGTYTITSGAAGQLTMTFGAKTQTISNANGAQELNFSDFGITLKTNAGYTADAAVGDVVVTAGSANFHIGANENQEIQLSIADMSATGLGVNAVDVSTQAGANSAITTIQTAIDSVSSERSKLGAYQNRLEHTINNLGTSSENLTSAESRVRDVNMAKEMSQFSKNNILNQAAQAMLSQANQQPQQVLQLLR
ncbi:flagellin [Clostridium sp. SHJSY1]|uniref:flagellin N-terminal helical domain-containing protein n=1 Tax=Clostridium sp. SHJSY1 TaxID=2942483 RepID=UPI0028761A07|nr:flagellin [Clostridium sp. SHJSY1]MDS0524115.1 flagellin [Clostridium sp. SHJSY1]